MRVASGIVLSLFGLWTGSIFANPPHLDLCDVSWLLPAPQALADLDDAISIVDVKSASGASVWSDEQFADLLAVVNNKAAAVGDTHVGFPQDFRSKAVWHIAAFRFDPSAPGCAQAVRDAFGSAPQIRLILQPVTSDDRSIEVHDFTVHLVFSFVTGLDAKHRFVADLAATRRMIQELDALKALSLNAGVDSSGKPLGVHPGLAAKVQGLRANVIEFLGGNLDSRRLSAMALMGIQTPEPWILLR